MMVENIECDLYNPVPIKPISEVTVGDRVAVPASRASIEDGLPFSILRVERLTAAQFITTNGRRRFRIADGFEVGGSDRFVRAVIVGDEFIAALDATKRTIEAERDARLWLYSMGRNHSQIPVAAILAMKSSYEHWQAEQTKVSAAMDN